MQGTIQGNGTSLEFARDRDLDARRLGVWYPVGSRAIL